MNLAGLFRKSWYLLIRGTIIKAICLVAKILPKVSNIVENQNNPGEKASADHHAREVGAGLPLMRGFEHSTCESVAG